MRNSFKANAVYHSAEIQAWEKRWFAKKNTSYGLMQQAAYALSYHICEQLQIQPNYKIQIWCGAGNNAGDGYLLGKYLKQRGLQVEIFAVFSVQSEDAKRALQEAQQINIPILDQLPVDNSDIIIDALFGIGLNRNLEIDIQYWIEQFNRYKGIKIAIDIPSGLHPNTGIPLPIAIKADITLTLLAIKSGLVIGQAQNYVGKLIVIPLIPEDEQLMAVAQIDYSLPILPKRLAHQHKGSFGHVLVIGGHPDMGGAVVMSGESAMSSGAGKVTVLCAAKHHQAIIARSPNIMLKDIEQLDIAQLNTLFSQVSAICFGMGLGRDSWAEHQFNKIISILLQQEHLNTVILDADALWFLAKQRGELKLPSHWIASPHSGEAATLLGCAVKMIEDDRIAAIKKLQQMYQGQWILKGAGTLTLENNKLDICGFGNPGMGTAGMGDVLSGMLAGLKSQFGEDINLAKIVALHALAGDSLAKQGQRGIRAQYMADAIYHVVNLE